MDFKLTCEQVELSDEPFGLTVTFRAKDNFEISMYETNSKKIMDSMGQYVMIQKTYGEEDEDDPDIDFSNPDRYIDSDFTYIESNIEELEADWESSVWQIGRHSLLFKDDYDTLEIHYNIDDAAYVNLKNIMQKIDGESGQITFV